MSPNSESCFSGDVVDIFLFNLAAWACGLQAFLTDITV